DSAVRSGGTTNGEGTTQTRTSSRSAALRRLGCQLPPGGGRTAAVADAGLEVGMIPPPGPSPLVSVSDGDGLLGAHSAPAGAAGALPEKVGGGGRGAEPPAWRAAPA